MKTKFILILLAVLLPLSALIVNADEKEQGQKIPLTKIKGDFNYNRSLIQLPIECCYMGIMDFILTTFSSDLGEVTLEVVNTSTGENSCDIFDSGMTPQYLLPISGNSGYYTITYITETGDIYEGTLTL